MRIIFFPKDSSSPDGRDYSCSFCVNSGARAARRSKRKVYAQPRWDNHPENNPEDYVTANCLLCDTPFFPTKPKNVYCTQCAPTAAHIYWSLSTTGSGWNPKGSTKHRSPISQDEMAKIGRRYIQSVACCYCDRGYDENNPKSFDHIIPKCNGGATTDNNIGICCLQCNRSKGGMSLSDWLTLCRLVVRRDGIDSARVTAPVLHIAIDIPRLVFTTAPHINENAGNIEQRPNRFHFATGSQVHIQLGVPSASRIPKRATMGKKRKYQ